MKNEKRKEKSLFYKILRRHDSTGMLPLILINGIWLPAPRIILSIKMRSDGIFHALSAIDADEETL